MCIGIVSECGVPMPDEITLKRCWDGNSDGAGFAYLGDEDVWQVQKGFMKWGAFLKAFQEMEFTNDHTVVIHFRIGTSGRCPSKHGEMGKGHKCTHPFPISDNSEELEVTEYVAKQIVIHNGVVGTGLGVLSDTQIAIRDHLSVLWNYVDKDEKIKELLKDLLDCGPRYKGSRWFIADGETYNLWGGWVLDEETKLWYTHDGYKPFKYVNTGTGVYTREYDWRWVDYDDTKTNETSANKTIVTSYLPGQRTFEFCSGGTWSWQKWTNRSIEETKAIEDADKVGSAVDDDTIREVYDATGRNVIALVDGFGNVVWDELLGSPADVTVLEEEADDYFNCMSCGGGRLKLVDLDEGCCPYCNTVLLPSAAISVERTFGCPNCKEKNHLGVTSFDIGDTECYRCGAVFVDTVIGEESIVTWNEDTKRAHEDLITDALIGEVS